MDKATEERIKNLEIQLADTMMTVSMHSKAVVSLTRDVSPLKKTMDVILMTIGVHTDILGALTQENCAMNTTTRVTPLPMINE